MSDDTCFWYTGTYHVGQGYNPGPTCLRAFSEGVTFFEMSKFPPDPENPRPPLSYEGIDSWPTGRFVVISREGALKMPHGEQMVVAGKVLLWEEDFVPLAEIAKQQGHDPGPGPEPNPSDTLN